MEADVFVVGALHLDVLVTAAHLPRPDETLIGRAVSYQFGGKGGNQAVAAARMGARVAMAGRVGEDAFGTRLLAALDAAGVERAGVIRAPGESGMSVAIVDAQGTYMAVVASGVNRDIRAADALPPEGVRVVLLQNEIAETVNLAVARACPTGFVVVNAAPARAMSPALLARTDLLVVNRLEAADITGRREIGCDPGMVAEELLDLGARAVIITLGADGLVGHSRNARSFRHQGHRVDVVSTHGAGDAFIGALAAELARGSPLDEAARFAQAAAALHVSRPLAERTLVTPGAVRAFLAAQSDRR